jgi:hypothetical protein
VGTFREVYDALVLRLARFLGDLRRPKAEGLSGGPVGAHAPGHARLAKARGWRAWYLSVREASSAFCARVSSVSALMVDPTSVGISTLRSVRAARERAGLLTRDGNATYHISTRRDRAACDRATRSVS